MHCPWQTRFGPRVKSGKNQVGDWIVPNGTRVAMAAGLSPFPEDFRHVSRMVTPEKVSILPHRLQEGW